MEPITKPVAGQSKLNICSINIANGTVRRTGTEGEDSGSMDYSEWDAEKVDAINRAAAIIATETVQDKAGYESGDTEGVKVQLDKNSTEKKDALVAAREVEVVKPVEK